MEQLDAPDDARYTNTCYSNHQAGRWVPPDDLVPLRRRPHPRPPETEQSVQGVNAECSEENEDKRRCFTGPFLLTKS